MKNETELTDKNASIGKVMLAAALFVCKSCKSELNKDLFVKNNKLKNGIELQCLTCRKEYLKKYSKNNRNYINKYRSDYMKNYRKTDVYKKQKARKRKKDKEDLGKGYIRVQLYKKGVKTEHLTDDIIEVQKLIIKTKRLCKTLKN